MTKKSVEDAHNVLLLDFDYCIELANVAEEYGYFTLMLGDFVFSFLVDDISDKLWHQDRERVLLERSVLLQHQ